MRAITNGDLLHSKNNETGYYSIREDDLDDWNNRRVKRGSSKVAKVGSVATEPTRQPDDLAKILDLEARLEAVEVELKAALADLSEERLAHAKAEASRREASIAAKYLKESVDLARADAAGLRDQINVLIEQNGNLVEALQAKPAGLFARIFGR